MGTPKFLQSAHDYIFSNTKMSWLWLIVRVYVGWQWLHAGYEKIINPAWVGETAGGAMTGFVNGALAKTAGAMAAAQNVPIETVHANVSDWYAWFLSHAVLPNVYVWSHMIAYGEVLVGLGLIVGLFTCWAAFFGSLMNMNFLMAGTVSTNPVLLLLALLIMMAHKIAGFIGLDYYWLRKNR